MLQDKNIIMMELKRREERNKVIMLQHLKRNEVYKPWGDVLILQIRAEDQGKGYIKYIVCRIRQKQNPISIKKKTWVLNGSRLT